MDNKIKKYLDRVVIELVRETEIDYDRKEILLPFLFFTLFSFSSSLFSSSPSFLFYEYCKNTFGLTEDETEYVWNEYKDIIQDKIKNGE